MRSLALLSLMGSVKKQLIEDGAKELRFWGAVTLILRPVTLNAQSGLTFHFSPFPRAHFIEPFVSGSSLICVLRIVAYISALFYSFDLQGSPLWFFAQLSTQNVLKQFTPLVKVCGGHLHFKILSSRKFQIIKFKKMKWHFTYLDTNSCL